MPFCRLPSNKESVLMIRHAVSSSARKSAKGFSLIEALIAAALLALMVAGIVPLFVKSLTDTARNRNQFHFNGATQAVMDELSVRSAMTVPPAIDPMLTAGLHVFSNANIYTASASTPNTVVDLFLGSKLSFTDKTAQNNLVGQIQYTVAAEFGRTRVDLQLFYFKRPELTRTMTGLCSGAAGINAPVVPSCNPAAPPGRMAVLQMSSYTDSPIKQPDPL